MIDLSRFIFTQTWRKLHLTCLVFLATYLTTQAQIQIGVHGGGNLSKAIGSEFRSSNRIGFQFGAFFTYGLNSYLALQLEPGYNLSRIRSNETTHMLPNGISKATRSVDYFNLPLFVKLSITSQFALLAGIEFNKLLTEEKHLLNNSLPAFNTALSTGYAFGVEFSKLYFRYRRQHRISRINAPSDAYLQQLQFGIRLRLLK